jgi:predicted Rossmann-fold nucleotide-binding protein
VAGYFERLVGFLDHAVAERFLQPAHRAMLVVAGDPEDLLERLAAYRAPVVEKWLDRDTT